MVRASQATTFSSESYFDDRGTHGYAQPITEHVNPHSRPIVSYYFPEGIGGFHYGQYHPMKPHRLTLVNALMIGYGLDKQIHQIYNPPPASRAELLGYHDKDYIDFLSRVTPRNQNDMRHLIDNFNCVEDCPIFADIFDFCCMYAGSSLAAARKLCAGTTDIAINWSGGLHHAKRGEASGFCYVNDIVLAILELLKYHPRVLYIDIDIHHGDGVEQAFYTSNRVMTVSFHKYTGDFFPGTGKLDDNGLGLGKYFSLSVPLRDGIDDEMYLTIFKTVIEDSVTAFRPSAIVLQCGADSLGCDRLGAFNLSIAAHGECVNFVRRFDVPLLVVGGGGYTVKNVGRCWTYETAVLVGASLPDELPRTIYDPFFRDSQWKLHPPLTGKVDNQNSPASLQRITINIRSKLRYLQGAPSVMMSELPPDLERWLEEEKEGKDKDADDNPESRLDRTMARNEFYDGNADHDRDEGEPEPDPSRRRRASRGEDPNPTTNSTKSRGGRRRGRPPKTSVSATPMTTGVSIDDETDESTPAPTPRRGRGRGRGRARARGRRKGRRSARQAADDVDDHSDKSESAESEEDVERALVPSTPNTAAETTTDNGTLESVEADTPALDVEMA